MAHGHKIERVLYKSEVVVGGRENTRNVTELFCVVAGGRKSRENLYREISSNQNSTRPAQRNIFMSFVMMDC